MSDMQIDLYQPDSNDIEVIETNTDSFFIKFNDTGYEAHIRMNETDLERSEIVSAWRDIVQVKDDRRIYTYLDERPICGAKKKNQTPCKIAPVDGSNRCRLHGGRSLSGIAHGNYQHGEKTRYMKYIRKEGLRQKLDDFYNDSDTLDMKEEIAVLRSRLAEQLEKAGTGESANAWDKVEKKVSSIRSAISSGNAQSIGSNLAELDRLVTKAKEREEIWQDIESTIGSLRQLTESYSKHLDRSKMMMTYEQAQEFLSAIISVVRQTVVNAEKDGTISQEAMRYILSNIAAEARKINAGKAAGFRREG